MAAEVPQTLEYMCGQLNTAPLLEVENFTNWKKRFMCHDFQDSPDDEEDTKSSQEYLNDLEEEYQARSLLSKSKRPTKDFEAKYNRVKAKLAFLSSSASASKTSMVKNKCLIAEAYEWDEEKVSSDDNEMVEVKVLIALAEDNDAVSKKGVRNGEWVKISMRKTDYNSADESSVCSTPLPLLEKLDGAKPVSRPKTIKSILKLKSTFKAEALKSVIINEPSSAPAKEYVEVMIMKHGHNRIISLEKEIKPRNLQHVIKRCKTYGSTVHNTTDHYDIEWFKRGEVLQAKNVDDLKSKNTGSPKVNRSKTPTRSKDVSIIELYKSPEPIVLETKFSSDQNGQTDQNDLNEQNDQSAQAAEIVNDDQSELLNHTNDEQIIKNLYNTEDIQISELLSSQNVEDTLVHDTIPIPNPSIFIPSRS
nr:hypothetical protein [Tanacetum cinerariifolium]